MNAYFSLTGAPSRSMPRLFSGTHSPFPAHGSGVPAPGAAAFRNTPSSGSSPAWLPGTLHPVSQGGPIHPELTGNLGDRAGSLYHHPGGFLLELRREITAFLSCHSIPSFPVKILLDPRPENSGHLICTAGYLQAEPALAVRDTQLSCGISTRGEVRKERLHIAAGGRQYRHDMTGVSRSTSSPDPPWFYTSHPASPAISSAARMSTLSCGPSSRSLRGGIATQEGLRPAHVAGIVLDEDPDPAIERSPYLVRSGRVA